MTKKIISIFLVCVTMVLCLGVPSFAKVSVGNVSTLKQVSASSGSVKLEWTKVKSAKGYKLYIYDKKKKAYVGKGNFSSNSATVSSLSPATTYRFKVKAYVRDGEKKIFSKNSAFATVVTAPDKVKNLKVSDKKTASFTLKWDAVPGADGYTIQKLNEETDKWSNYKSTTALSKKITKTGKYRVLAYKLCGETKLYSAASAKATGSFKYVYSESGTFTFTVYGYGHGVGMSQTGATYYAENGWSYKKILTHYYKGTKIVDDNEAPKKVKYGDKKYPLYDYLCRVTQAEIGNAAPLETIKAQVVACYSYAKYKGFSLPSYDHAFSSEERVTDKVREAVDSVIGKYVSYDGKACLTPYFSISAGKTASCEATWGGKLPYLSSVDSSPDKKNQYWKTTCTITSEEFKERFLEDFGEELKGDPSKWIKIISHDNAVSSSIGYVSQVSVGSMTFKGEKFRTSVMHYSLRSHCFTVSYKPD